MSTATQLSDPYWSRTGSQCELAGRQDPVIWQSAGPPVYDAWTKDELSFYDQQGFSAVDGLISQDEAQELLCQANSLAETAEISRPDVIAEPNSNVVRSLFKISETNDAFQAIAADPRLVNRAKQLLGSEVYIHQSRINFKPAFNGKEFFWHSDFETWHTEDGMPRMRAVSVSINLTANHEFNGPLMLIPGSHRSYVRCVGETPHNHFEQSLKAQRFGVPSCEALEQLVNEGGIVAPQGSPGSAVYFDCNTMHGSSGNLSPFPRTNLFIVYNSVENPLQDPYGGTTPRPDFLAERNCHPIV